MSTLNALGVAAPIGIAHTFNNPSSPRCRKIGGVGGWHTSADERKCEQKGQKSYFEPGCDTPFYVGKGTSYRSHAHLKRTHNCA